MKFLLKIIYKYMREWKVKSVRSRENTGCFMLEIGKRKDIESSKRDICAKKSIGLKRKTLNFFKCNGPKEIAFKFCIKNNIWYYAFILLMYVQKPSETSLGLLTLNTLLILCWYPDKNLCFKKILRCFSYIV